MRTHYTVTQNNDLPHCPHKPTPTNKSTWSMATSTCGQNFQINQ